MGAVEKNDLVSRVKVALPRHTEKINPKYDRSKDIPMHKKVNLSVTCHEKSFGAFYEILANLWFGGSRTNSSAYNWGGDDHDTRTWSPDLVTKSLVADQKTVGKSVTLKLRDTQIANYHDGQMMNPGKRVAWQFFRHNLLDVISKGKKRGKVKVGDVYEMLASETLYAVDLPLSLVTALWINPTAGLSHRRRESILLGENGYFNEEEANEAAEDYVFKYKRKNKPLEKPYTGVKSSTINSFFLDPEGCINQLERLTNLFKIEYTSSPSNLIVEGFKVKEFPVVKITDKHNILWIHDLIDYFKPQNRFSDSNEKVARNLQRIENAYNTFCRNRETNGFGYRTNNADLIARLENDYRINLERESNHLDDVPF